MSTFEVLESFAALKRKVALIRAIEAKNLDMGHNQISVIYKLSLGPASMGELADYTYSDKSSISRTVAQLEKTGYVKRVADKEDRRIINIQLTAKGDNLAKVSQKIRSAIGKKLDEALDAKERKQLAALVQKVVDHI